MKPDDPIQSSSWQYIRLHSMRTLAKQRVRVRYISIHVVNTYTISLRHHPVGGGGGGGGGGQPGAAYEIGNFWL